MSLGETVKLMSNLIAFSQLGNSYGFEVNSKSLIKNRMILLISQYFFSALENWATIFPENVKYSIILP